MLLQYWQIIDTVSGLGQEQQNSLASGSSNGPAVVSKMLQLHEITTKPRETLGFSTFRAVDHMDNFGFSESNLKERLNLPMPIFIPAPDLDSGSGTCTLTFISQKCFNPLTPTGLKSKARLEKNPVK